MTDTCRMLLSLFLFYFKTIESSELGLEEDNDNRICHDKAEVNVFIFRTFFEKLK